MLERSGRRSPAPRPRPRSPRTPRRISCGRSSVAQREICPTARYKPPMPTFRRCYLRIPLKAATDEFRAVENDWFVDCGNNFRTAPRMAADPTRGSSAQDVADHHDEGQDRPERHAGFLSGVHRIFRVCQNSRTNITKIQSGPPPTANIPVIRKKCVVGSGELRNSFPKQTKNKIQPAGIMAIARAK